MRELRMILLTCFALFAFGTLAQEQKWQEFESIGYSRYSHPLVNVAKDGKKYYYHLDSGVLMDEMKNLPIGMSIMIKDGAYGVIRDDGKLIVPFAYDDIKVESDTRKRGNNNKHVSRFILLQKENLYGYADTDGNILAAPKYQQLKVISPTIIAVAEEGRWGWLDARTGKVLQPCIYENVDKSYAYEDYVKVKQEGKYGLAKKDGTIVVPITSERTLYFPRSANGSYILTEQQGVHTLYDSLGNVLLQGDYPHVQAITNSGLLSFKKDNLTGLIDPKTAKVVLEPQFSSISSSSVRGLYLVTKDKKNGVANEQGKLLLPLEFDRVEFVNAGGQNAGNIAFGPSIPMAPESDYGNPTITITAERVARMKHEAKTDSLPYYILVRKGKMLGLLDWEGKPVIPLGAYNAIRPHYYDGKSYFVVTRQDNRMNIRDIAGKNLLPTWYLNKSHYKYNTTAIKANFDLQTRYVDVYYEQEDDALYPGRIGLFDLKTSKMVVEPHTQTIKWLDENYFKVIQSDKKQGTQVKLYHADGKHILDFPEDIKDVEMLNNGLLMAEKVMGYRNGVYILMDMEGKVVYENPQWKSRGNFGHIRFPEIREWVRRDFHGGLKKMYTEEPNLFINEKGEEKRFSAYEQVDHFYGGYAMAAKKVTNETDELGFRFGGDRYYFGFIDSTGTEVFPPTWHTVLQHGVDPYLLQVRQGDKNGLIDRRGKVILRTEYDYIESGRNKPYLQIKKDGKLGLMTPKGDVVVEPRYEQIRTNHNGEEKTWPLLVKEGEWYYFVGKDGKPYPVRAKQRM